MKWNNPKVSWTLVAIGLLCLQATGKMSWLTILIPVAALLGYGVVRLAGSSHPIRHGIK